MTTSRARPSSFCAPAGGWTPCSCPTLREQRGHRKSDHDQADRSEPDQRRGVELRKNDRREGAEGNHCQRQRRPRVPGPRRSRGRACLRHDGSNTGYATAVAGWVSAGGVLKLWCGGGDGSVHSSPVAPSHTRAGAFSPPRTHLMTIYTKTNWLRPKPNAPMLEIMLRVVNCSG